MGVKWVQIIGAFMEGAFSNQLITLRILDFCEGGGECGIRTHGTLSRTHAFQACALSRSAISPVRLVLQRQASIFNAARNALCGISTLPNWRIRFLPSFCLSSSLRLRLMSPP